MTPRAHRALTITRLALGVATLLLVAGCAAARREPTYPPAGATPQVATTQTSAARAAVTAALAPTGLEVADATQAFEPREGPWLASAPRTVLELDAPGGGALGFIVLYGLGSATDAATAAADQASYVEQPTARVYFPNDAHFTIRVLGAAVVFFTWSPASGDPRLAKVESALGGVGTGVPVAG